CIGVDPYYLAQKAQEVGYHPEIILAGRRLNDGMGKYVATEVVKMMVKAEMRVKNSKVLMLGITFKENCPDIRNTRAIDIYNELQTYQMDVDVYDPWANPEEVKHEFGMDIIKTEELSKYDTIILAVAHREFLEMNLEDLKKGEALIYDVKGILPKTVSDKRL
ncbi:MAG TPA: nucleotide sugar dehydrogenase, partial [Cryomorphaceae bacterium]|nr:nucleotide sugar dehydrogenase [Cryomorphaceae bacterium]